MRIAHLTRCGVVALAVQIGALVGVLSAPTAAAGEKVVLGGGAGIVVDGRYCTLATIGHDKTGELVGFTAAHCGGPGAQVVAEGTDATVGTVVATNDQLDYAVIKLDPTKVAPTANFAGFAINGIGADPEWHQSACELGAATGDYCRGIGSLPGPGPRMSMRGHFQPGDEGGPVTSGDLLIGMITGGVGPFPPIVGQPPVEFIHLLKFSAIRDDTNANGGPGAGFAPVSN